MKKILFNAVKLKHALCKLARNMFIAVLKRTSLVNQPGLLSRLTPNVQMGIIMARSKGLAEELKQKASSPKVLFIVPRGSHYDLVLQTCLAYRLMFEGAYCSFMVCQDLPICNKNDIQNERTSTHSCISCQQNNVHFLDIAKLPSVQVDQFVSEATRAQARNKVANLTFEQCQQFEYKSYPLGNIILISVTRYMLRVTFDDHERNKATEVYRDFLYGAIILLNSYLALIAERKPDIIVMVNGKLIWSAVMMAVTKQLNIKTVCYEDISTRFVGRTWAFIHNRPLVDLNFDSIWQKYKSIPLTTEQNKRPDDFLNKRRKPGLFYRAMESDEKKIRAALSLTDNKKPVTIFPNVTWDTAAQGKDIAFDNVIDWVLKTVRYFIDSKRTLIVRVHPAEGCTFDGVQSREKVADIIMDSFKILPTNIKIIDGDSPISSYALLKMSGAALVYTSTLGIEAALYGLPAIVAGRSHYSGKGFTYEVSSLEQYYKLLESISKLTISPSQIELARRYAYLYYFQIPIQIDLWNADQPCKVDAIKINTLHDLAPGKIKNLDIVANGILHQTDFVLPSHE